LLGHLQDVVAFALKTLLGGTGGEVAGPVAVVIAAIGEKVLGLVGPGLKTFMHRVQVAGGGRVKQVEGGALGLTLVNVPGNIQNSEYRSSLIRHE